MTVFLRVLEASVDDKPAELLRAVVALHDLGKRNEVFQRLIFERDPIAFAEIPGSPFAYWVSDAVRSVFSSCPDMTRSGGTTKCGAGTLDDFRFLRLWWESNSGTWVPFPKGGAFSRWYADVPLLVAWNPGGQELKTYVEAKVGSASRKIQAQEYYFRPGLTWPRRTNGLSFRAMPADCIFADKGPAAFVDGDSPESLLALSVLMNSQAFGYLVSVQLARTELAQSYEVGLIQQTPVPELSDAETVTLARLARRAWSLKRSLDTAEETSHAFLLPHGPNEKVTGLNPAAAERELDEIQREIDERAFRLYGIGAEDRAVIEASSKRASTGGDAIEDSDDENDDPSEDEVLVGAPADTLLSWLVGVAFGRFDPRLATRIVQSYRTAGGPPYTVLEGQRPVPAEPEPFDPLPSRSPGMWPENEVAVVVPPVIMVDDSGHDHDIRTHVADAAAATGWPDPSDLRQWLAKDFFPLHIKMYSKSRRKAPIYWQLATPSASYSIWLYIHAFSNDTLFRVQNDYVAPKLAHEERQLEAMVRELQDKATAAERKELAAQETFVEELRAFLDEVKRVAPLWKPNLDDGVIINFAPLWRLVPQHKPWQKELKATWDALCDEKYDWGRLAMHLWPERVVPKCAADRSLAIAHGLEEVLWIEGSDGKWTARKTPTRPINELVRERTSPAVKAALKSLLETPAATGGGQGRRAKRKTVS